MANIQRGLEGYAVLSARSDNAANFSKLEVAWRFKTDSFGPFPEYKLEGTPVMASGVLYTTAGTRRSVVALDGKTARTPMTHCIDGTQYVVVAVGGGPYSGEYLAFSLPDDVRTNTTR